jgi:hypothetical protein
VSALDDASTRHFADGLADETDFKAHLDNILVPRVPGSQGNVDVRNVSDRRFLLTQSLHAAACGVMLVL